MTNGTARSGAHFLLFPPLAGPTTGWIGGL